MRPVALAGAFAVPLIALVLAIPAPALAQEEVAGPSPSPAEVALQEVNATLERSDLPAEHRARLELYRLITRYRADNGLPPLVMDARLMASATEHAKDMAEKRMCRHRGSDGSTSRNRMARNGYKYNNWAGENIVCGRASAETALHWWKNSGPHRRNLLHRHFTHIGIGYAPNGPWGPQWALNFAAGASDTVAPDWSGGGVADPPAAQAEGDAPDPEGSPE